MIRLEPPHADEYAPIAREMLARWQLLNGQADTLVRESLTARYGRERAAEMAWTDSAANPYALLHAQAAALYHDAPRVSGGPAEVSAAVSAAGHWGAMQRNQRDVLALREIAVLVETAAPGRLSMRTVYPHRFHRPRPRRLRPREIGRIGLWLEVGDADWMLMEWEIEDETGAPSAVYRSSLYTASTGQAELVAEHGPETYPWRRPGTDEPFVPVGLYHAAAASTLLDWQTGMDVATGAIGIIIDSTAAEHAFDHASYRQHVGINVIPEGARADPTTGQVYLTADPAKILMFRSDPDAGGPPSFVTLEAPADPEALQRYVRTKARDLAAAVGIPQASVTRDTGEVKSAAALMVSAADRAEMQRQQKPVFLPADREILTIAAWVLGVESSPEDWRIEYPAVQLSPSEMAERMAVVERGQATRTMSRLSQILYIHPHLTEAEGRELIATIDAEAAPDSEAP